MTKGGGRFNESKPKSELDWVIYRAKKLPGPADCKPRPVPLPKEAVLAQLMLNRKLTDSIFCKKIPGPNAYDRPPLPKQGGGRFNVGNSKSEIEWILLLQQRYPWPCHLWNVTES